MYNEIENKSNTDHFNAISSQVVKLLLDLGQIIANVGQNIALKQAVQGKAINVENNLDF